MGSRRIGWRQSRGTATTKKRGGFRGGFGHRMNIPKNTPTPIMPIGAYYDDPRPYYAGNELPFYLYRRHRQDRGKKPAVFSVCSAGWKDTEDPHEADDCGDDKCVFCHEMKTDRAIDMRVMGAWPFVHLAWYHLTPVLDEDGNKRRYSQGKREGQVIYDRVMCTNDDECEGCKKGYEEVYGATRFTDLSVNFRNQLGEMEANIARACGHCHNGLIEPVALICPKCKSLMVDLDGMSSEQVDKLSSSFLVCPECGERDIPDEEVECGECNRGRPATFEDVILFICKEGQSTSTSMRLKHPNNPTLPGWCWREDFKDDDGEPICWLENKELVYDDTIKELMVPFDFNNMLGTSPDPVAKQAKRLGVKNPFGKDDDNEDPDKGDGESRSRRRRRSRRSPSYE